MLNIKKYKRKILLVRFRSAKEYKETVLMLRLLHKQAKTSEERIFIRQQSLDLLKISIILVIAVFPGGSLTVALIETGLQKVNRTILPTSFNRKSRKKLIENSSTIS